MATRLGPGFDRLSIAAGVSNLGDGAFTAAFPLLAASLTRDPALVAGATLASRLPWFLFALVSGALVDRMDRRKVMVAVNGLRAVGMAVLAVSVATSSVDLVIIYLIAFGLGVAETFFDTSAEAIVPSLVGPKGLPSANARLQALEFVGNSFAGPPLGAFLFTVAMAAPFGFNAVAYAMAALILVLVAGTHQSRRLPGVGLGREVRAGLTWLWGQRVVRTLTMLAGATNLFVFGIVAIFVLFAQDVLGVSDAGYGILLATLGLGGLAGALAAPRTVAALGPGTSVRIGLVTQIACVAMFVQLSQPVVAGMIMFVFGATISMWNVVAVSLRQALTPDELRGRVAGAARLLAWGTQPLGALVGGVAATALGLRAPFAVAAVGLAAAVALAWPVISNATIAEAEEQATPAGDQTP